MSYPVDVPTLVRASTLGARAGDPTIPYKPSRSTRLASWLRRRAHQEMSVPERQQLVPKASRSA